jgi:phospholipase D1/2
VEAEAHARGSLIAAIEALRGGESTLVPNRCEPEEAFDAPDPVVLCDPERPVDADTVVAAFVPPPSAHTPHPFLRAALVLTAFAIAAALWRFSPAGEWLRPAEVLGWVEQHQVSPVALLVVVAVYAVASLLMVPVNVLIVATAVAFGPALGGAYAMAASLATATLDYAIGRALGAAAIERLVGKRVELARRLTRPGVVSAALMRLVPSAPFAVVNLVAGASRARLRDVVGGTALGMAPGILVVSILGGELASALRGTDPDAGTSAIIGLVLVVVLVLLASRVHPGWSTPEPSSPAAVRL